MNTLEASEVTRTRLCIMVVQERVAQERQQPALVDMTPEEEFSARLEHALSTLQLEVSLLVVQSHQSLYSYLGLQHVLWPAGS